MVAVKYFGLERKSRRPKNPNQVEAEKTKAHSLNQAQASNSALRLQA
jgi:hypothetical protein